jgi:hypothetical protein
MKFWKRLRWASTLAFIALLLLSWFGSDTPPSAPGGTPPPARLAPTF